MREAFPTSLRVRFGVGASWHACVLLLRLTCVRSPQTDDVRNGFHGSEDGKAAEAEIHQYFPQLSADKVPTMQEVQEYMLKKAPPTRELPASSVVLLLCSHLGACSSYIFAHRSLLRSCSGFAHAAAGEIKKSFNDTLIGAHLDASFLARFDPRRSFFIRCVVCAEGLTALCRVKPRGSDAVV